MCSRTCVHTSHLWLKAQVSPCVSFHVIHARALVIGCLSVLSSPVSLLLPQVLPPLPDVYLVTDENSMEDPLCNSSLDYVTPDTSFTPSTCPCSCERFSSPLLPDALLPFPPVLEVRRLQPSARSAQRGYGLV